VQARSANIYHNFEKNKQTRLHDPAIDDIAEA